MFISELLLMNLLRCGHPDTDALLPLSDIQLPRIMGPTEAFANCHVILHTGWSTASAFYFIITIVGDMVRLNINLFFVNTGLPQFRFHPCFQ